MLILYLIIKKFLIYIKTKLIQLYPKVYCILVDNVHEWPITRTIFCYFIGVGSAFFFWKIFIVNLNFSLETTFKALIFLIIILGPGFTFSKRIRCIVCLIFLGCFGKSGRSYLRGLFFILIISGPITNLALNTKEVVRVFACATILTFNLTKTRFDLMTSPFRKAVVLMKDDMHQIKESLNEIESVVEPVRSEIEDEDDEDTLFNKTRRQLGDENEPEDYQKQYENKISRRCKLQFQKGTNKCKQAFAKMYDDCIDKMPTVINYLLCWPMKIDLMCHMTSNTEQVCNPEGVIDPQFGKNYKKLKNIEKQFGENTTNVEVKYTVISPKEIPGVISAQETGKRVVDGFNKKMAFFQFFMNILNRILAFIFIKLVLNSIKYNKNYLKNIDFDNLYITKYYKKIDGRRKNRDQHSLLPLKKFEKTLIIDPEDHSVKTKAEKSNFFVHMLKFVLELTTVMTFLFLDYVFYFMLKTIRKHSRIEFHQRGTHNINFHINGTGLIAKLLRSSLLGFNTNNRLSTFLSNEKCLPNPSKLSRMFYFQFWSIVLLILTLIYHEVPLMRTRRLVCSFFYPKREKKRVLHLYNSMLKRRRVILKNMRKELLTKCQKNKIKQDMNFFICLRLKFPKKMGWLIHFKCARRKCLICEELEPVPKTKKLSNEDNNSSSSSSSLVSNNNNLIVECPTENCKSIHCKECWRDIGEICLACYQIPNEN